MQMHGFDPRRIRFQLVQDGEAVTSARCTLGTMYEDSILKEVRQDDMAVLQLLQEKQAVVR
jgi:hypothetical protein